jgi:hypothetical protein
MFCPDPAGAAAPRKIIRLSSRTTMTNFYHTSRLLLLFIATTRGKLSDLQQIKIPFVGLHFERYLVP